MKNSSQDLAVLAITRSQNPDSVIFYCCDLCNKTEIEDHLVEQIGSLTAISTPRSKARHFLVEALFTNKNDKQKALTTGLTINNEHVAGFPRISSDVDLIKINLYGLRISLQPTSITPTTSIGLILLWQSRSTPSLCL